MKEAIDHFNSVLSFTLFLVMSMMFIYFIAGLLNRYISFVAWILYNLDHWKRMVSYKYFMNDIVSEEDKLRYVI